jgi:type I restriction enzyme R subunit
VVWHTQGSGKSFEMVFYAAKIMRDPRMANPTLVFITDRNDLDDQLFGETFAPARILPETPVQATTRSDLRAKLKRASGGIVFTTLQKFAPGEDGDTNPVLTDRRNVIVIADEAHRSQYGFSETLDRHGRLKSGLAKHMRDALPGATYLGFTGTPIESNDKSTRAVFGDYVDVSRKPTSLPWTTSPTKSPSPSRKTQQQLRSHGGRGWRRSSERRPDLTS